jgi:hypothetical protein
VTGGGNFYLFAAEPERDTLTPPLATGIELGGLPGTVLGLDGPANLVFGVPVGVEPRGA